MLNHLKYLINSLIKENILAISVLNLADSPISTSDIWQHRGSQCMCFKSNNSAVAHCSRYKNKKIQYVLENKSGFFDVCPNGILDYVYAFRKNNPCFIIFVTFNSRIFFTTRKSSGLSIHTPDFSVKDKELQQYYRQVPIITDILERFIFSYIDPLSIPIRENLLHRKIHLVHEMIAEHFKLDISLASLSREFKLSKSMLAQYYKKFFSMTVREDIEQYRIKYAKQLLKKKQRYQNRI